MRAIFGSAIIALAALIQTAAAADKGIELDSREYKLMLETERFAGGAPQQAVRRFARDQLSPPSGGALATRRPMS